MFIKGYLAEEWMKGVKRMQDYLPAALDEPSLCVVVERAESASLQKTGRNVTVRLKEKHTFYYALSVLLTDQRENYECSLEAQTERLGAMLDCSRNAVLTVDSVKRYIVYLALLGFDHLQLYTEDTYEVTGEDYFGYMRGRYTQTELAELDAFARLFGIELVPCIQTLAHLNAIFRWQEYKKINDIEDILLVKNERTYQLVDRMFAALKKSFSTKRVHVGMDEAHLLGQGEFKAAYGDQDRGEIVFEHLEKVAEIAQKYGFELCVWHDMFIGDEAFAKRYNALADDAPLKKVRFVFWNYIDEDIEVYRQKFGVSLIDAERIDFAGGAFSWNTFTCDNSLAIRKIKPAMELCREKGIKNVTVTSWGDDGGEASRFSILPALLSYAEYSYAHMRTRSGVMRLLTGYTFEEFKSLELVDRYIDLETVVGKNVHYGAAAKYLLYNDPFYGLFDHNVPPDARSRSIVNYNVLEELSKRKTAFSYLFATLAALANVLIEKADLSVLIKKHYDAGDRKGLTEDIAKIEKILDKLKVFQKNYETQWLYENKPFGLEVQQIRLGGLRSRIGYVKRTLNDYLEGNIDRIAELEEKRLPGDYTDEGYRYNLILPWSDIVTCGRITR